ncbi:hypothetical protein SASPL_133898 [Salvia splendens]|uniref:Fungal lipase-type domain-containing protein n=1 Tax=Salvia splendens TaxID=180675 RepID=A0A8X8X3X0_SALSN|nr:GDSL esterase/lipase At4g10955-like [Salvia splendens]KAG6406298.1 hypothetical protein SASPL_133898 [Salvia splendens]
MSDKEKFHICGPSELPSTMDWSNLRDQKSVVASFVRGTYVLELDHLNNRQGNAALAPPWFESFGFELSKPLVDDDDDIFGAVYRRKQHRHRHRHQPSCVVAFRGTNTKGIAGFFTDSMINIRIWSYTLEKTGRFQKALEAVRGAVEDFGVDNVWIAGHSQGAATALLVGKSMARMHGGVPYPLKVFLFNPPFIGSTNRIWRLLVAMLAVGMGRDDGQSAFAASSCWYPLLFVHPEDPLCCRYIKYFHQRRMRTAQHTARELFFRAESTHLIPSAVLVVNHTPPPPAKWKHAVTYMKEAHGIYQWWSSPIELKAHQYTFHLNPPFSTQEMAI